MKPPTKQPEAKPEAKPEAELLNKTGFAVLYKHYLNPYNYVTPEFAEEEFHIRGYWCSPEELEQYVQGRMMKLKEESRQILDEVLEEFKQERRGGLMTYDLVDSITCTTRAYDPSYVFQVVLSDLAIERLRYKYLLGLIRIEKHESQFLSDLADVLSAEILEKLVALLNNSKEQPK